MSEHDDHEPHHASSPTDHLLTELQLHGYRPFQDEADPRPLPGGNIVAGAIADIFDALIVSMSDTRLEPDLDDLLWSTVNLFHRATARIELELDDNEQAQRRSQREQDGSEVKSVDLERLTRRGADHDRAPKRLRVDARRCRRALRAPHRIIVAAAQWIDGQSSHTDLRR